MTDDLQTLAQCLSGHYDNRTQALNDPVWYVHLHCWIRLVPLFADDSLTLFAEQAPCILRGVNPSRPPVFRHRLVARVLLKSKKRMADRCPKVL
jgi:hypothetical protein